MTLELMEITIDEVRRLHKKERKKWLHARKEWLERQRKQDEKELNTQIAKEYAVLRKRFGKRNVSEGITEYWRQWRKLRGREQ